jgi:hypothetical protein
MARLAPVLACPGAWCNSQYRTLFDTASAREAGCRGLSSSILPRRSEDVTFHFSASPSSSFDLEGHGLEIRRGGVAFAPR